MRSPDLSSERRVIAWHDQAWLSAVSLIVVVGLAIDTRRHRMSNRLDTFYTPAHGLVYAGWAACAVVVLQVVRTEMATGARRLDAVPQGFEPAAMGVLVFGIGGVGDLIWHTVFGIEQELKILFSPTHLLLMVAMLMVAFGTIRSAWMTADPPETRSTRRPAVAYRQFWPVALAAGSMMAVLVVFLQYASPYEAPIFSTAAPFAALQTVLETLGSLGVMVTTTTLFGIALLLARRWVLPFATFCTAFGVVAMTVFIFMDFRPVRLLLSLLVGALACDVLAWGLRRVRDPRQSYRLLGAFAPPLVWSSYVLFSIADGPIAWSAEQWTGTIVWSGLIGLAFTALLLPPQHAPAGYLDPTQGS